MSFFERMQTGRQQTFAEFWPAYLRTHSKPGTRAAHYLATLIGIASVISACFYGLLAIAVAGIGCALALAVGSHWIVEGNL